MAENSRARKFIFILDCCHSGGFKGGPAGMQLAHGSGRCLITACASDQLSADATDPSGASMFTHYLAEALTSGDVDSDGDGIVLTSEVFKYVQPRVYNATRQTVQWSMDKTFGEAAIARAVPRSLGAQPPPVVKPEPELGRPVLEVSETRIEFRDVQAGEKLPVERLDVFNSGEGRLNWVFETEESWIKIERKEDSLWVTLDTTEPGLRRGNIFIRDLGRGGARTVRVLLQVSKPAVPPPISPEPSPPQPPVLPPPVPADPMIAALQGWWSNNAGAVRIRWENGVLAYTDFNLMAIQVGQGTLRVQNGVAYAQGVHSFGGSYTGQFTLAGQMLNGMLTGADGRVAPVSFVRRDPWFAGFR